MIQPWFKVMVAVAVAVRTVPHMSRLIRHGLGETQIFEIFNILKIVKNYDKKIIKNLAKIIKYRADSG